MAETIVEKKQFRKKPNWLRVKLPTGENFKKVHTICESGSCPNMGECWGAGTATFMILGNVCTRSCSFCAVQTGRPTELDTEEPQRVAQAIQLMDVKHAVITSVNRDELKDRGAQIWYETVRAIKTLTPKVTIETLIPDVKGNWEALELMISASQEVVSHNMETVERLYRLVRPQAKYARSLEQIQRTKTYGKRTKSGCDILTIGQYLQPTKMHLAVTEFIKPEVFEMYKTVGLEKGLKYVESGPLVRSSYHAERHVF